MVDFGVFFRSEVSDFELEDTEPTVLLADVECYRGVAIY